MAWSFSEEIHALTGFDAASNSDSETGEDFRVLSAQWLTDAAREVINILPPKLKQKCSKVTNLYIGNTDTTMDLDGVGEILHVTRENANSGYYIGCREVSPLSSKSIVVELVKGVYTKHFLFNLGGNKFITSFAASVNH